MDSAYLQLLIQGGAVSIALVTLWMLYKSNNGKLKILTEIIEKHTASNCLLAGAVDKNTIAIDSLERTVQSKFN